MRKNNPVLNKFRPKDPEKMYFLSLAMLVLAFIFLCLAIVFNTGKATNESSPTVQTQRAFEIGEIFTSGQVKLEVSAIDFSDGKQPFLAPEGMQYVVIRLHVTNQGDHPINILPTSDTYIKSADGTVSYLSPFGVAEPFRSGELLPGETVKGDLSYLIKRDDSLKFYIDSIWSGAVLPVRLK